MTATAAPFAIQTLHTTDPESVRVRVGLQATPGRYVITEDFTTDNTPAAVDAALAERGVIIDRATYGFTGAGAQYDGWRA